MPVGTFFKTSFERGIQSHQQILKSLQPLFKKTPNANWNQAVSKLQYPTLIHQANLALNSRNLGGKLRCSCIPSSSLPPNEILKWQKEVECTVSGSPEVFVAEEENPSEFVSLVNKTASSLGGCSSIYKESLSKEVMQRLENAKDQHLFLHDATFGSQNYSVITNDASVAVALRKCTSLSNQDPKDFASGFNIFHISGFKFLDQKVIEEFGGVTQEDLGISSPHFVIFNISKRTVHVSGNLETLKNAILCMGSLLEFHSGNLTLNGEIKQENGTTMSIGKSGSNVVWSEKNLSQVWKETEGDNQNPTIFPAEGATLKFVSETDTPEKVAKSIAGYPLGSSTKKLLAERFEALVKSSNCRA